MFRMSAVCLSILVLCALKAEGGTVKPYLSLISGYDDNITLQSTAKDMFFSLIPGIKFKTDDKILFVTLDAEGKYIAYRKYTEHNRTDCLIKSTLEWHPAPYEFLLSGKYLKGEETGLTTLEVSRRITALLKEKRYLINPSVTVSVIEGKGRNFSILGEVRKPVITLLERLQIYFSTLNVQL